MRPDVCSQPNAGASVGLVCVVIFLSLQGRSHFRVMLAPVGAVCILPGSWHHFEWAPAKGILGSAGLQENMGTGHVVLARFVQACCKKGTAATLENFCQRLEGTSLQETSVVAHAVSKLGGECWCCVGSHRCLLGQVGS